MIYYIYSTSIAALAFAGVAILLTPYLHNAQYCYAGIETLSALPNKQHGVNCFTVSRDGTFGDVFTSSRATKGNTGYVIPGLWDGHGHLLQYGEFLNGVDLFGARSLAEVNKRIWTYMERNPNVGTSNEWIRGVGWDQTAFGGVMPTAADLAASEPLRGKFIMLDRIDVHCIWVSEAVLGLLPKPLPFSPPGGEIVIEPGPGVFCDNAMDIVLRHWPAPGKEQKRKFIKSAMTELNRVGLVGVHDAGVKPEDVELYSHLADTRRHDWTLRVYAMRECDQRNTFCLDAASRIITAENLLRIESVKLFADGALGSWGSAMLEPYTDHPWTSGSLLVNATTLTKVAKSWAAAGFQVNIHAIGDRANRLAIDAQEEALRSVCHGGSLRECQKLRRFRIEHAQIVDPDDQKRMHDLGIIPSIQPTHATSDMEYAELRLGNSRIMTGAYRMRSFLSLQPVLGSDFPVEPPNPFQGIYAAIARRNPRTGLGAGGSNSSWHVEESLSLRQALDGFTRGPAHGAFLEGKAGVIQPGAFADWVVLDRPLDEIPVDDIRSLRVRETWLGGRQVYKRGT